MLLGIASAFMVVMAKESEKKIGKERTTSNLGLTLCCSSLLFSSMELIVVAIMGSGFKMNSIDTLLHMALPVFIFLLLPSFLIEHPVAYDNHGPSTDWSILMEVAGLS